MKQWTDRSAGTTSARVLSIWGRRIAAIAAAIWISKMATRRRTPGAAAAMPGVRPDSAKLLFPCNLL